MTRLKRALGYTIFSYMCDKNSNFAQLLIVLGTELNNELTYE